MKIVHLVCVWPPYKGGMGQATYEFAKGLAQRGHEVKVLTPQYRVADGASENMEGFKVWRLKPFFKYGNAAILVGLKNFFQNCGVIHLHYPFYGTEIMVWWYKIWHPQAKLILHYHMDTNAAGIKGFIFRVMRWLFLGSLARLSSIITCASLDYIENSYLKKYYQAHPEKFQETLFGVDLERFKPSETVRQDNRLLFVGSLDRAHYFKGVEVLIRAVARLDLAEWQLDIVGWGDLLPRYRALAQELNLGQRIKFFDQVSSADLPSFYQRSQILILPSLDSSEAFGMVLLEAMACGTPVIASNLAGLRQVFHDGQEGLLIKPGDVADLTNKINQILKYPDQQKQMSQAARQLAVSRYNWSGVLDRLEKAYQL